MNIPFIFIMPFIQERWPPRCFRDCAVWCDNNSIWITALTLKYRPLRVGKQQTPTIARNTMWYIKIEMKVTSSSCTHRWIQVGQAVFSCAVIYPGTRNNSVRNTTWILITSKNINVRRELKPYKFKASSAVILNSTEFRATWGSSASCQVTLLLWETPMCSCPGHARSCWKDAHHHTAASSSIWIEASIPPAVWETNMVPLFLVLTCTLPLYR